MVKSKGRILYADILKIITIYAVLLVHVCGVRWYTDFGTNDWFVLNTFLSSIRWCIPVFFMLSGMMILDPDYNLTFKKLYTKSLPRLLCALIFWSLAYRIASPIGNYILHQEPITSTDIQKLYTDFFFDMPWHHLWFMYVIIGIYILAPLLRIFTANAERKHFLYFLLLYLVFGSIIPRLEEMYSTKINFHILDLYSYTGYFIAGYFFAKYDLKLWEKRILYAFGIATLLWSIASSTYTALQVGAPVTHYFGDTYPHNMIMAYALFVFMKNKISNSPKLLRYQDNKYITSMANCVFGIYLVHDFFNVILKEIGIDTSILPAIISAPLLTALVFLTSYGVILLIKRIPILNKWIV